MARGKYRSSRAWRDELSDAISLQQVGPGVSRNTTDGTVEFTTAANLSDYIYVNVQLNHDRAFTSNIFPHIHYFQDQNAVPNFLLQYRWQINGAAKVTAWTNLIAQTLAFTYVSGTIHQIAATVSGIASPTGSTVSDIVQFRIYRDNANNSAAFAGADAYTGTVGLLAFDVHLELDANGSMAQYSK